MSDADKVQNQMIADAGVEMAVQLMENAVTDANSQQQATNHMNVLFVASVHIIATIAFNNIVQAGRSKESVIVQYSTALLNELNHLLDNQQEMESVRSAPFADLNTDGLPQ